MTLPHDRFRWHMKQRGAVLAKGRLYWELARRANEMAFRLRDGLSALGCAFPLPSPTNQQFPVLPNSVVKGLQAAGYRFEVDHAEGPDQTCIRLVTSWATPEDAVNTFLQSLADCKE